MINRIAQNGSYWIDFIGKMEKDEVPVRVQINLDKDALSQAFLILSIDNIIVAFLPINEMLSATAENSKVTFIIQGVPCQTISILFDNVFISNMVQTQIVLCSYCSEHSTKSQNYIQQLFSNTYCTKVTSIILNPVVITMFPFSQFEGARKTWLSRNEFLNSGFFTTKSKATATFLTWNVEQKPPADYTHHEIEFIFSQGSDFVVIALEEIDFSVSTIIFGGSDRGLDWDTTLCRAASLFDYEALFQDQLGGVLVKIFKLKSSKFNIKAEGLISMRFGAKGLAANKSCVASKIIVDDTVIVVIGAHLQAQVENAVDRTNQLKSVLSKLDTSKIDYTVILGDLNYRIDRTYDETIYLIKQSRLEELLGSDQLKAVLKQEPVLTGFEEGEITFKPTFKFDEGSNVYDSSPRHRVPSWTDRVLVRAGHPKLWTGPTDKVIFETDAVLALRHNQPAQFKNSQPPDFPSPPQCTLYRSYDVQFSDHRPVVAQYSFDIARFDEDRHREFARLQIDKLNQLNNLAVPRISVDPPMLEAAAGEPSQITLKNDSVAIGQWQAAASPDGVRISPESGILRPGETAQLSFEVDRAYGEIQLCSFDVAEGSPCFLQFVSQ